MGRVAGPGSGPGAGGDEQLEQAVHRATARQRTGGVVHGARPAATLAWRVGPPATTATTLAKPSSASSLALAPSASGCATTTTAVTQSLASIASTAWTSSGRPASRTSALGPGLLLVAVACEHQLGDEDLAGALQHALLAGGQALLAVADGEVADHLGDLEDVAGLEALDVALETAAPVALGGGLAGPQDLEDAVDVLGAADLADADLLAVVAGDHEGQVAICQLEDQILPGLAAYLTILEPVDDGCSVLWVDDAVPDLEHT